MSFDEAALTLLQPCVSRLINHLVVLLKRWRSGQSSSRLPSTVHHIFHEESRWGNSAVQTRWMVDSVRRVVRINVQDVLIGCGLFRALWTYWF